MKNYIQNLFFHFFSRWNRNRCTSICYMYIVYISVLIRAPTTTPDPSLNAPNSVSNQIHEFESGFGSCTKENCPNRPKKIWSWTNFRIFFGEFRSLGWNLVSFSGFEPYFWAECELWYILCYLILYGFTIVFVDIFYCYKI